MVRVAALLPEVKSHYGDLKNYVGGGWRAAEATEWLEDTNPATGRIIARVPLSTKDDIDAAVQEALRGWGRWRRTTPSEREPESTRRSRTNRSACSRGSARSTSP